MTPLEALRASKSQEQTSSSELTPLEKLRASQPPKEGIVSKTLNFGKTAVKGIVEPVATMVARPIQAGAALSGVPLDQIDTYTKAHFGDWVAPTPTTYGEDVGRAVQTVALGAPVNTLGKVVAGGAAFGLGASMENKNPILSKETAQNVALGAAGGALIHGASKLISGAIAKNAAKNIVKEAPVLPPEAPPTPPGLPIVIPKELPKINIPSGPQIDLPAPGILQKGAELSKPILPKVETKIDPVVERAKTFASKNDFIAAETKPKIVTPKEEFTFEIKKSPITGKETKLETTEPYYATWTSGPAKGRPVGVTAKTEKQLIKNIIDLNKRTGMGAKIPGQKLTGITKTKTPTKTQIKTLSSAWEKAHKVEPYKLPPLDKYPKLVKPVQPKVAPEIKPLSAKEPIRPTPKVESITQTPEYVKSVEQRTKILDKDPEFVPGTNKEKVASFDRLVSTTNKNDIIDAIYGRNGKVLPPDLPATAAHQLMKLEKGLTNEQIVRLANNYPSSEAGKLLQATQVRKKSIIDNAVDFISETQNRLIEIAKAKAPTKKTIIDFLDDNQCTI